MNRMPVEWIQETTGLRQPAAQLRMLKEMGIRAERNALGEVVVLREWLAQDARVSGETEPELNL